MPRYQPANIEPKWQAYWEENKTFKTPEMPAGEKLYALDMFPYPSGSGLHVGHPEGYTATDIVCRHARMNGKTVLHPMGFDAFGLPAEEHAIKTNTPPRVNTEQNIATFRRQLKMLGFSYDWDRELATTDVEYFKWTQWIFLVLFDTWFDADQQKGRPISELPIPAEVKSQGETAVRKYQDDHRLAYQSDALVNWCPALGTVLANEEVIDGKSERGSHPVVRMPLRQWMLRITAYADRLEKDLEPLDWPEGIKKLQRDWIGRSVGAEVDFYVGQASRLPFENWKADRAKAPFPKKAPDNVLRIYTTRPDTLFGATYMVIAPEHPFVARLTTPDQKEAVEKYIQAAASKSDRERQEVTKTKTGVFTGSHAINPVNGQPVPIWVADYVLWGYGTGAIMAVPAHDERDFEFATTFGLPVRAVVDPGTAIAHSVNPSESVAQSRAPFDDWRRDVLEGTTVFSDIISEGESAKITLPTGQVIELLGPTVAVNSSDKYDDTPSKEFKARITADLAQAGLGREAVNYKLRDWLFSRQRFWGEPFPILHELDDKGQPTGLIRAVDPKDLPVDLPHLDDYKPHGRPEPPLAKAPKEWLEPVIDGKRYRRETNTMPQWAGSCWYFLRFIDPRNQTRFVDAAKEKAWMPIDLYVGGAEHAVLHLLYSRFWHKVLFDRGHVSTVEPFRKLVNQGMILGEMEHSIFQDMKDPRKFYSPKDVEKVEQDGIVHYEAAGTKVGLRTFPDQSVVNKGKTTELHNKTGFEKDIPKGELIATVPTEWIESHAYKMSKSRANVINPDQVVNDYGADSLRLYEMFMGPLEAVKPWSMAGVVGVRGFLDRAWRLMVDDRAEELKLNESVQNVQPSDEAQRVLHKTIKYVTNDIQRLEFNTAIARMMEFTNYFTKQSVRPRAILEKFILILSPFAPHIAEELWQLLGHNSTLAYEPWPTYDEALTQDSQIEIPVQILGKLRGKVIVPAGSDQVSIIAAAREDEKIAALLAGKEVVKTIVVPGKLVNFVVK